MIVATVAILIVTCFETMAKMVIVLTVRTKQSMKIISNEK